MQQCAQWRSAEKQNCYKNRLCLMCRPGPFYLLMYFTVIMRCVRFHEGFLVKILFHVDDVYDKSAKIRNYIFKSHKSLVEPVFIVVNIVYSLDLPLHKVWTLLQPTLLLSHHFLIPLVVKYWPLVSVHLSAFLSFPVYMQLHFIRSSFPSEHFIKHFHSSLDTRAFSLSSIFFYLHQDL